MSILKLVTCSNRKRKKLRKLKKTYTCMSGITIIFYWTNSQNNGQSSAKPDVWQP